MRSLVLFLGVVLVGHGALGIMNTYKEMLQILIQLHSRGAVRLISNSTGHETHISAAKRSENQLDEDLNRARNDDDSMYKRNFNINSPLYTSNSYKFPVDSYLKNAMIAILGQDGVLEKGGFYMDGYIKKDGTAFIKMVKSFRNRTVLIDELKKVRSQVSLQSPLSVIVHLLLTRQDTDNLIKWQKEQIQKGHFKQDDPCAPKMIVMYKCCTPTVLPLLGPEFGSLRIATD